MNTRKIYAAAALVLLFIGVGLALYYRSYEHHPETVKEEQIERLTARFLQNPEREMNRVPTWEEVKRDAEEIVCARVKARTLMAGYDLLSEMEVTRVLHSESGLKEGETIWVYEPVSVYMNPDPEKLRKLDVVYEEGWIQTDGFQLPLREELTYLLFLKRREIADCYQYSERDQRTFLFSNRLVSAFPVGIEPVILEGISPGPAGEAEAETPIPLWKDLRQGVFIVNGAGQREQLEQLIADTAENCGIR